MADGKPLTGWSLGVSFPFNYAWLFGGAAPLIWLAAALGATFVLPTAETAESGPEHGLGGGWHSLREFFGHRPVLLAAIGYLLVYSGGNAIFANVSLYAPQALRAGQSAGPQAGAATARPAHQPPAETTAVPPQTALATDVPRPSPVESEASEASEANKASEASEASDDLSARNQGADRQSATAKAEDDTQGLQNLLRFSFKAVTGLALGWLLATRGPRAALVATTGLLLLGIGWALQVTGWWYL
ncbi:MAG: hypothetical protein ACKOJF_34160, partial [Planctomycetaceae bacterium]